MTSYQPKPCSKMSIVIPSPLPDVSPPRRYCLWYLLYENKCYHMHIAYINPFYCSTWYLQFQNPDEKKITRRSPIWKPESEEEPSKFFSRNGKGMTPCKNCGLWFLMSDEHGNLSYKQANGPTVERVRKQRLVQGPTRDMNPLWTGTRTMWSNLRVLKKVT